MSSSIQYILYVLHNHISCLPAIDVAVRLPHIILIQNVDEIPAVTRPPWLNTVPLLIHVVEQVPIVGPDNVLSLLHEMLKRFNMALNPAQSQFSPWLVQNFQLRRRVPGVVAEPASDLNYRDPNARFFGGLQARSGQNHIADDTRQLGGIMKPPPEMIPKKYLDLYNLTNWNPQAAQATYRHDLRIPTFAEDRNFTLGTTQAGPAVNGSIPKTANSLTQDLFASRLSDYWQPPPVDQSPGETNKVKVVTSPALNTDPKFNGYTQWKFQDRDQNQALAAQVAYREQTGKPLPRGTQYIGQASSLGDGWVTTM